MKKGILINSELSYVIATLGHGDGLAIGDSGLPVPEGVQRIDLAVSKGVPGFLDVLDAVLSEQRVEEVVLAKETKLISPEIYAEMMSRLNVIQKNENIKINIIEISHDDFKNETRHAKAVVRTGEYTPYANIILKSGVVF